MVIAERPSATPANKKYFAELIGEEFVNFILDAAPRKVGVRVGKALDHYEKALGLEGLDDEMGAIRLIAGEEELVVAIFEQMKLNADKLPRHQDFIKKFKNHLVKLAFHPVLTQFRFAIGHLISDGMTLDGFEDKINWTIKPIIFENKVTLQIYDNEGKELVKVNPLNIIVNKDGLSEEEVLDALYSDFAELVRDQLNMSVKEYITARADYRNRLLYAADGGYVAMKETLTELLAIYKVTYRDLLWALGVLLGNDPPGKEFGLAGQFISLYRRALTESKII